MIGRTHRFHGHKALNGVYRNGRTVRSEMIGLRFAGRGPGRPYRAAVVVSRKVNKSAVKRNRIRRRIYSTVRDLAGQPDSAVKPGTDLVFTVFNDQLAQLPPPELKKTIAALLKKSA